MSQKTNEVLDNFTDEQLQQHLESRKREKETAERKKKQEWLSDKENFLGACADTFLDLQTQMRNLKEECIARVIDLHTRMYALHDKAPKDQKSYTFQSEDKRLKIVVESHERIELTEEAKVHLDTIRGILKDKFAKRHKGLYEMVDGLLIRTRNKEYDARLLAKARPQIRKLDIAELSDAFAKLEECQVVVDSSFYCRFYIRDEQTNKYKDITLQFAAL